MPSHGELVKVIEGHLAGIRYFARKCMNMLTKGILYVGDVKFVDTM